MWFYLPLFPAPSALHPFTSFSHCIFSRQKMLREHDVAETFGNAYHPLKSLSLGAFLSWDQGTTTDVPVHWNSAWRQGKMVNNRIRNNKCERLQWWPPLPADYPTETSKYQILSNKNSCWSRYVHLLWTRFLLHSVFLLFLFVSLSLKESIKLSNSCEGSTGQRVNAEQVCGTNLWRHKNLFGSMKRDSLVSSLRDTHFKWLWLR